MVIKRELSPGAMWTLLFILRAFVSARREKEEEDESSGKVTYTRGGKSGGGLHHIVLYLYAR